jgi:hypothetical protein
LKGDQESDSSDNAGPLQVRTDASRNPCLQDDSQLFRCGFQAIVLIARAQLRRKSPLQPPARHSPYRSRCSVLTPAYTRAFDTRPTSSDSIRGKPHPGTLSPIISCPSPGSGSCDNSSAPATPTIGRRHRSSALPSPAFAQSMKNEAAPVAMRLHLRPNPRTLTSLPLVFPISTIYPIRKTQFFLSCLTFLRYT